MGQLMATHSFEDLWHPWVFLWLLLVQAGYLLAVGKWREAFGWGPPVSTRQKVLFSSAIWMIYLSEGTPLHILAEHYLFSMHMIQHVVLTSIMVPLLVLGIPDWAVRNALKRPWIRGPLKFFTSPIPAILCFNLIYAVWHMPVAYEATLYFHWFHMVQHALLVLTSIFMWWPVASPVPEFNKLSDGASMLYLFVAGIIQIAVYSMLTFAESPIYEFYWNAPRMWGIDPLVDQQAAGMIMNLGGMVILLVVWGIIFFNWVRKEEAQAISRAPKDSAVRS